MKHEVRKCDIGRRCRSFLPPLVCVATALLITCSVALTSQASEELSQAATSGKVPANESSAATPQIEKSVHGGGSSTLLPLASDASNGDVPSKIQDHGRAVKVVLDGSLMVNTIARKNPDGSVSIEYITGNENEANALVERSRTYIPGRKENYSEK